MFLHVDKEDYNQTGWMDAQADLIFHWPHMLKGTFSHTVAHFQCSNLFTA